jgi:NAD(P)-dependent dehydrogenase (short-subunit alcohol dehydrogenase family)
MSRLLTGALAGLAATGVMSGVMLAAKRLGALGEPPPRRLTRRLLSTLGAPPRGRALDLLGTLAHFGYGAALGSSFALLPVPAKTFASGTLFGLGVWAVNYAGWLPQVGLMPRPERDRPGRPSSMIAAHLAFGAALAAFERRLSPVTSELRDKVVVIGGGTRGLGRAVARELLRRGARVAICGRSPEALEQTRQFLEQHGTSVLAEVCDLRLESQAIAFIEKARRSLGPIDVVIANAATIDVGPIDTFSPADFDSAMSEIFGTATRTALAALPQMRARGQGMLVFITSIGGRLGVPHLAPYTAAKFAEVGFAEALQAEVRKDGVRILTVVPGLMRTGSHLHASFRGQQERELGWFGSAALTPLVTIDADRAARHIVRAIARGDRYLTFTPLAGVGAWLHDMAPNLWSLLAALMGALLPRSPHPTNGVDGREGRDIARSSSSRYLHFLDARSAALAERHGQ